VFQEENMRFLSRLSYSKKHKEPVKRLVIHLKEPSKNKKILSRLTQLNIEELVLNDSWRMDKPAIWQQLFKPKPQRTILATVSENQYIKTLILNSAVLSPVNENTLEILINMHSLEKLSLPIMGNDGIIDQLKNYLTNQACALRCLEITGGMCEMEYKQLRYIFRGSRSLIRYEGPYQDKLQEILDEKNNTHPLADYVSVSPE
jgi:hypothetical protein